MFYSVGGVFSFFLSFFFFSFSGGWVVEFSVDLVI